MTSPLRKRIRSTSVSSFPGIFAVLFGEAISRHSRARSFRERVPDLDSFEPTGIDVSTTTPDLSLRGLQRTMYP